MLCLIGLYLYNAIECREGRVYRIVHYAQKGGVVYGIFCAYCTKTTGAWKIRLTKLKNQFRLKILSTKFDFPYPLWYNCKCEGAYRLRANPKYKPALDSYL